MTEYTALELGRRIRKGEISAVEAAQAALTQIDEKEALLHAYIRVDRENYVPP